MRLALQCASGKIYWHDAEDGEPMQELIVPAVVPGHGFVNRRFIYFGIMHTPNENSYQLYVEHQGGGKQ